MNDEFGIGASAKFVQVHANAFPVGIDAEGKQAIEERKEKVGHREHESQQCCDAKELGEELTWLRGEDAGGNEAPEATYCMHRDRARRIVEGDAELEEFNQERDADPGY